MGCTWHCPAKATAQAVYVLRNLSFHVVAAPLNDLSGILSPHQHGAANRGAATEQDHLDRFLRLCRWQGILRAVGRLYSSRCSHPPRPEAGFRFQQASDTSTGSENTKASVT